MSLDTILQQNDIGITLIVTIVQQDGVTPQDISSATSTNIYITKPDYTVLTVNGAFVTGGTDGKIFYITQTDDLNQVGIYKIEGSYSVGGNIFYTEKTNFLVEGNF